MIKTFCYRPYNRCIPSAVKVGQKNPVADTISEGFINYQKINKIKRFILKSYYKIL